MYDLTATFTRIRFDIRHELNIPILKEIIGILENKSNVFEFNQIRNALASIEKLDKEVWYFIKYQNVYTHFSILKNTDIYKILIKACKELIPG